MAYDGNGNFSLPAGNPVTTGTDINSTVHNNTMSEIATGLSTAITKDGQTTVTANLPMAGYRHTGVGNPTARTQYASVAGVQDGTYVYLTSVSGTNTITATAALSMSAYATGQTFIFIPAATNTGATTLNLNSIGAKNVYFNGGACVGEELIANIPALLTYDGTQFHIVSTDGPRIIGTSSPSAVATVDFTTGIDTKSDCYELDFQLVPATDDVYLYLVVGTGATPTWQTGGGAYSWGSYMAGPSSGQDGGSTSYSLTTRIALSRPDAAQGVGSDAGEHIAGRVRVWGVNTASEQILIEGRTVYKRSDAAAILWSVGGLYGGTGVTALRLAFSSGNIESGSVILRKWRKT
jgi:hypothetical protein